MIHTSRHLLGAAVAVVLAASSVSAQVLFQDNFDSYPDGDTASVWEGGTTNDPSNGDADPVATIGTWNRKSEKFPWYGQVSTATNGPTTGPAGGTGKYLTLTRDNDNPPSDFRGTWATAAAGQLSIDFQTAIGITTPPLGQSGAMQFFVRNTSNTSGDQFAGTLLYFNINPNGTVDTNDGSTSLTFDPSAKQYNSFNVLIDVPAQKYTIKVNGIGAGDATNLAFSTPTGGTSIAQFSFYVNDTGVFGIDNVLASVVPSVNADFNGNSVVDAADYVLWRKNDGISSGAAQNQGDANGDGAVDSTDYGLWRGHFGLSSGSGSSLSAGGAVPEPSSAALLALGSVVIALLGRRATRS